jgi:hypothetical protein
MPEVYPLALADTMEGIPLTVCDAQPQSAQTPSALWHGSQPQESQQTFSGSGNGTSGNRGPPPPLEDELLDEDELVLLDDDDDEELVLEDELDEEEEDEDEDELELLEDSLRELSEN